MGASTPPKHPSVAHTFFQRVPSSIHPRGRPEHPKIPHPYSVAATPKHAPNRPHHQPATQPHPPPLYTLTTPPATYPNTTKNMKYTTHLHEHSPRSQAAPQPNTAPDRRNTATHTPPKLTRQPNTTQQPSTPADNKDWDPPGSNTPVGPNQNPETQRERTSQSTPSPEISKTRSP